MACDYQTLLDDAACFAAMPEEILRVQQTQLLCELSGIVSGGAGPLAGSGTPEGVQTGQIAGQTYFRTDNNTLYAFGGTVGTNTGWHVI